MMAFINKNFDAAGTGMGAAPKISTYRTADNIAVVEGAGYFNEVSDAFQAGDVIYANMGDGNKFYAVTISSSVVTLAEKVVFTTLT
jgi:hypothetical protein